MLKNKSILMKTVIFMILLNAANLCFFSSTSEAQIKKRSQSKVYYTGAGYKFVMFTDGSVQDAYPFFDLSTQAFVKEVMGFFGIVVSERVAVELAPSYLFSNDYGSNSDDASGFYFEKNGVNRYYVPTSANMHAIPVNLRVKYFPFAKDYGSFFNMLYIGAGGGPIYVSESMDQRVYADESKLVYQGATRNEDSFWTMNFEALAGIATVPKFGVGFEIGYRFIPLGAAAGDKALITSTAKNFNNLNLAINVIYKF